MNSPRAHAELTRRSFLGAAAGALSALALGSLPLAVPQLLGGKSHAQGSSALRIGTSLALSGVWAVDGLYVRLGYEYWADNLNAAGGLLGRPVELVVLDDASTPEQCAENYRRLINDGCDMLLGPYGSVPTTGALPVIEAAGYPCAIPISASPSLWATPRRWCVQITPNADTYMDGPLARAAAHGARTVALVYLDSGFTGDIAAGVRRKASELGLNVVADAAYANETVDFEALLAPIAPLDPDVLIGGGYIQSAMSLTRTARRLDLSPRMMCWMEAPHRWPWPQWMGTEGDLVASSGLWLPTLESEGNAAFVRGFSARYGTQYRMEMMGALNHQTASGYAAALVTQRAVEAAGTLDRAACRDALFGLKTETPYGRYEVNERGAQIGKSVLGTQWVDGRQVIFWPSEHAQSDLVYPFRPWRARI